MKEGTIFGFLCLGSFGKDVYRFGKSSKVKLDPTYELPDQKWVFLSRLFGGMNQPRPRGTSVVFFEKVKDLDRAWDSVKMFLRGYGRGTELMVTHLQALGDNFFSVNVSNDEFRKHLLVLKETLGRDWLLLP